MNFGKLFPALLLASSLSSNKDLFDFDNIDSIPIQPKPPKGYKEYWFNEEGEFSNGDGEVKMLKTETVFYCYAHNDTSAKKKFSKWQQQYNIH